MTDATSTHGPVPTPVVKVPAGWRVIETKLDGYKSEGRGPYGRTLRVIVSHARELDGEIWCHVSASIPGRTGVNAPGLSDLPTWVEMCWVRDRFIGPDRWAYQLHPPHDDNVNLFQVLHLWSCVTDPDARFPDFTAGTGTI